ncbi:MAG: hypothetical protein MJ119_06505 [Lachnospiraceae bacterium]|nr:hypothetical protein [Lachnospiraceae bacterium]
MKLRKIIYGVIVVLMLAVFILGAFILLNKKNSEESTEENVNVTALTEILLQDLNKNYPPTPKELLKYYSEITCCFYNNELNEDELVKLAGKAREIYDDELVATMTDEEYVKSLKEDILNFKSQNIVVSGYSVSASTDVELFSQNGYDCARLYATYRLRQGTEYIYSNEVFILRKDEGGHWKIYGWALDQNEADEETDVENAEASAPVLSFVPNMVSEGANGGLNE